MENAFVEEMEESTARGGKLRAVWDFFRHQPLGAFGAVVLILLVFCAIFASFVATQDPYTTHANETLVAPGWAHLMGTDFLGRDMYSRIVHGSRVSLAVGLSSTAIGGTIGLVIGLLSGYLMGWWDLVAQRLMDIMQGLPLLVMALVMSAVLGPSVENVILAISIPLIPRAARVIRSSTLAIRELPFVEAARAMGMGEMRIAFLHVMPNTLAPFIVLTTAQLGSAILTEAALSFLGLGIPEPYPSWGRMLSESAAEYAQKAPWLVIFPGLAISFVVFATNLLGDALRDILDPRLRI
ncbi:MAG TPA: ABC transporter permease [bacterium]|nr:ABC transporter permease [bacterium]